jgi:hypothetical protein
MNQRYWLQYHWLHDVRTPTSSSSTHLIRPSDTSEAQVSRNKLVPFRQLLNLTHTDTYIHGPFDFATVNGRKTRDRISQVDWGILALHSSMFHNAAPCFDLPSYSIHVDRGVHIAYCDTPNILPCVLPQTSARSVYTLDKRSRHLHSLATPLFFIYHDNPTTIVGAAKRDLVY